MAYQQMIARITGADEQTVPLLEELMRTEHPTLDGLSLARFIEVAQQAVADALLMEAGGILPGWCEAFGLPVIDVVGVPR